MRALKFGVTLVALCALAACGKGITVGSESSASADESRKVDVDRSRNMSTSTSAKVSVTMPGATLVAQTLRPLVELAEIDMPSYVKGVKFEGAPLLPVDGALAKYGFVPGSLITDAQVTQATALQAALAAKAGTDVVKLFAADQLLTCTGLVIARDEPGARQCFTAFHMRTYAAAAILAASWPQKTPGIKGERVDLISKERSFPVKPLNQWISGNKALQQVSGQLQHSWITGLPNQGLRDPDQARLELVKRVFATPLAEIQEQAKRPTGLTGIVSNGELNGALDVFIPEFNEYIAQSEKGLVTTRSGAVFQGDGFVMGGKTDIALESSTSASMDRKLTIGNSQSDKAGSTTKAGANLP